MSSYVTRVVIACDGDSGNCSSVFEGHNLAEVRERARRQKWVHVPVRDGAEIVMRDYCPRHPVVTVVEQGKGEQR